MSVRELEESQKMLCTLNLVDEAGSSRDMSSDENLLASTEERVDLWSAKTEVFEVIRNDKGENYRMRCLHHNAGL